MSVINQMLKDLESRNNRNTPAQELLEGHARENRGGRNRKPLVLIALLLLPILGYLGWQRSDTPAAQPAPQSTVAGVEKAVPVIQRTAPPVKPVVTEAAAVAAPPARPVETEADAVAAPPATPVATVAAPPAPRPLVAPAEPETSQPPAPRLIAVAVPELTGETAGVGNEAATEADEPGAEIDTTIEKRIRPLRPEQLAERAYEEGYTRLQHGDRAGAETAWRKGLVHDPRHIANREGLAGLYLSQGRRVEAGELLADGLVHHPGYGQFALLSARLQVENGETAAALVTLEKALESRSQGAEFLAFLAAVYQRQKSFDKSVAAYQHALSQQPRNGTWWMGLGISQEGAGKYGEAITAYNEAKNSGNLPPRLVQYVEGRLAALAQ
jgi:MSHA biogenesis protein MshN